MKKYLHKIIIICLICVFAAGCSAKAGAPAGLKTGAGLTAGGKVDLDLTSLNGAMVYAEVYNMMSSPDEFLGKTIKMKGPYYASYFEATGLYYHYIIIEDATSCCQQGLEFIWSGDHKYPDDFPEEQAKIEVTGVFDCYDELDKTYYYVAVDDITVLSS